MSAVDALQFLAQVLYAAIFVVVAVQAIRGPTRVMVDITLFFGATASVIACTVRADRLMGRHPARFATVLQPRRVSARGNGPGPHDYRPCICFAAAYLLGACR